MPDRAIVRRPKCNRERYRICGASQPLTSSRDAHLRFSGQRDRNARGRGRFQGAMSVMRVKQKAARDEA
jgi:hypothetical protein